VSAEYSAPEKTCLSNTIEFQPPYYSYGIEGPQQQRLLCAGNPLALKVGFVWSIPYRTKSIQIQQCGFPLGADPPVGGGGRLAC